VREARNPSAICLKEIDFTQQYASSVVNSAHNADKRKVEWL